MPESAYNHQKIKLFISAVLLICTIRVFLPGSYSIDSWSEYNQMISGRYDDWFGPALPFTWHVLWRITGKFISLYLLQMLLYWLFITLILWHINIKSSWFLVVTGLAVFFCFIPQYIMRDSLMAIAWGIAAIILFRTLQGGSHKIIVVVAVLLLGYGLWVRPSALPAIVPLIWACLIAAGSVRFAAWKYLWLSIGVSVFLFLFALILTYSVLHTSAAYPAYKLKLLDIAGISKLSGENYMPDNIRNYKDFNNDTLIANYTPASFDNIYWPEKNRKAIIPYPDAALNNSVNKSWMAAITTHPLLYIQNRGTGFLYYLRIRKRFKSDEYWNVAIWIDPNNPLRLQKGPNKIREGFSRIYNNLSGSFFYDPWFWLLLNVVTFTYFIYQNRKTRSSFLQMHACIQLSGIIYMLSQFFIYQHDRDFRYTYWNVFVAIIAISAFSGIRIKKAEKLPLNSKPIL